MRFFPVKYNSDERGEGHSFRRPVILRYLLAGVAILSVSLATAAEPVKEFERPPTVKVTDLITKKVPRIPGILVVNEVPTDGVMGTFTIKADAAEFGDEAGTYTILGRELFELRMSEIPAIIELRKLSSTKAFAQALGQTTVSGFESVAKIVKSPREALAGVPSGVDRLFGRVQSGVQRMQESLQDSTKSGAEVATLAGKATRDALGYEQERRMLARSLGVDPYTTNRILAQMLDDMAWASFAGRLGASTVIRKVVPGGAVITGARITSNLVWDIPKGDLIVRVEDKLRELQLPKERIAAFMHNKAVPLSLQVAVVGELDALAGVTGREQVLEEMADVTTESQARFLASSLRMLAEYHLMHPLATLTADGPLLALDRNGLLVVPAPVDYLSWSERVAQFASSAGLPETRERLVWIRGGISPRAQKGLESTGWTVRVGEWKSPVEKRNN